MEDPLPTYTSLSKTRQHHRQYLNLSQFLTSRSFLFPTLVFFFVCFFVLFLGVDFKSDSVLISPIRQYPTVPPPRSGKIIYNEDRGFKDQDKMNFVKEMMKHSWSGYMKYAAGADEVDTSIPGPHNWYKDSSLLSTAVDALDTLWIMNLTKEYVEAKKLVLRDLNFNISESVSVFETTIRIIGGLNSAFEFEEDIAFINKSRQLADIILSAFLGEHQFPVNFLNLVTKEATDHSSRRADHASLAEYGTLQLEFQYLSDITGNSTYQDKTLRIYDILSNLTSKLPGLYPSFIQIHTLEWASDEYGIGAMSDSYYEYLLKVWLSTGEERFRAMFDKSADAVIKYLLTKSHRYGVTYLPDRNSKARYENQHHLTCFAGGWFALGALSRRSHKTGLYLDVAHRVTEGCYDSYGSDLDTIGFENAYPEKNMSDHIWIMRPELVESLMYMWRFTHDPIYREWGWDIAQRIERNCKATAGYHGLPQSSIPVQQSFFLAETLKYLYLLFTDDDVIPLEKYVFNTEAHPISIRGHGRRSDPTKWVPIRPSYTL